MVRKDGVLPDRCLKCNEPAGGFQFKRSLTWASPWYALLILLNLILYIVVYLIVSRRGNVTVGVCPLHRRKRRRAILLGWLTFLAGIGSLIAAAFVPSSVTAFPAVGGGILMAVGVIGGMLGSRILVPARIDKHFIWLTKVSPVYLATFPDSQVR